MCFLLFHAKVAIRGEVRLSHWLLKAVGCTSDCAAGVAFEQKSHRALSYIDESVSLIFRTPMLDLTTDIHPPTTSTLNPLQMSPFSDDGYIENQTSSTS